MNSNSQSNTSHSKLEDQQLKPRRASFMFPRLTIGFLVSITLTTIAAGLCFGFEQPLVYCAAVFIILSPLLIYSSFVAYRKESYELLHSTIIRHQGGLLSDQTTEIEIRNITHVKLRLPWLRHKFFNIGTIMVESAGSDKPVKLSYIREPQKIYDQLWLRMQNNGYDLTMNNLLHETRPALLGAFFESAKFIVVGFFLILGLIGQAADSLNEAQLDSLLNYIIFIFIPIVGAAMGFLLLRVLDFRKRSYRIFNDVVTYKEGFLTKHDAFIPYENISDASSKQTFWAKIFGLYNVIISCQGAESEIKFNHLRHGPIISNHIDRLVTSAHKKPKPTEVNPQEVATLIPKRIEPDLAPPEQAWLSNLKINPARYFIPLLLILPIFPLWVILNIKAVIMYISTSYSFNRATIGHSVRFLSTNEREFAYEKITGLTIKRNLFDRLFGTATLKFWSIGSKESMEIAHVSLSKLNLNSIMRQIGIPETSEKSYPIKARYNPIAWMRARCYQLAFLLTLTASLIGLAVAINQGHIVSQDIVVDSELTITRSVIQMMLIGIAAFILTLLSLSVAYLFLYYKKQKLNFNEHHITAEQGLFIHKQYFARYKNIKKVGCTKYPLGTTGSIEIFVAGEEQFFKAQKQKQTAIKAQQLTKPCSFHLHFIPDVFTKGVILDDILCGRLQAAPQLQPAEPLELLVESGRSVGNALTTLLIWSIILAPAIILLPFTIPLTFIITKRWRYRVEAGKILTNHGVLFKKQMSILLNRVDSIQQNQGALGKIFRNGKVSIMTAGSSNPDMQVKDSRPYKQIYQEVRRLSQTS